MFTGIIQDVGTITSLHWQAKHAQLTIDTNLTNQIHSQIGDSIAVDGICLTITNLTSHSFTADVMPETVRRTNLMSLGEGSHVNLEPALAVTDRLDGHFVLGHIDATATLIRQVQDQTAATLTFSFPTHYQPYVIEKGSVAINGVSLTITAVSSGQFSVSLIPHTMAATMLGDLQTGDPINLETDILGKYLINQQEVSAHD